MWPSGGVAGDDVVDGMVLSGGDGGFSGVEPWTDGGSAMD